MDTHIVFGCIQLGSHYLYITIFSHFSEIFLGQVTARVQEGLNLNNSNFPTG